MTILKTLFRHTDLISKFLIPGNPGFKTKAGRYGGTWVCEELLYSYTSWISTQFHKAVLDAFTAAVSGNMIKVREIVRTAVRGDIDAAEQETIVASCSSIRFRK